MLRLVRLLVALQLATPALAHAGQEALSVRVKELDAADRRIADAAFVELGAQARELGAALFDGFEEAPLAGRLARAELARGAAHPMWIEPALRGLSDPDRRVRRALVELLADPRLSGGVEGERRSAALERIAQDDVDDELRLAAIDALARLDVAEAARALARLIASLPSHEALRAATALAQRSSAQGLLIERVQAVAAAAEQLDERVLAALVAGYGAALGATPTGGEAIADRAPFVVLARHPSGVVRRASLTALDDFVDELRFRGEEERADRMLAAFAESGLERTEWILARVRFALERGGDPLGVQALVESLRSRLSQEPAAGQSRALVGLAALAAATRIASGEPLVSLEPLDLAVEVLERELAERLDLVSAAQAALQVQRLESLTALHAWKATAWLASGAPAGDARVLECVRTSHATALRTALAAAATDGLVETAEWRDGLDHRYGPFRLLFRAGPSPALSREARIELAEGLLAACASVAPDELPGFRGVRAERGHWRGPTEDPERLVLLQAIRSALMDRLRAEIGGMFERDPGRRQREERLRELERGQREDSANGYRSLLELRSPSLLVLDLCAILRGDGRSARILVLAGRAREDLQARNLGRSPNDELILARLETQLGNACTDLGDGATAQQWLELGLERLEALAKQVESFRMGEDAAALIARQRADVLTSLAVNANVKLLDPDRALAYFERGYALDASEFGKLLLACYRARAGRAAEARALLAEISIAPAHFYNLACTWALLGETETALDFLRREFGENHKSPGSLQRQLEWARGDPDLRALHADARFQALLREVR